MAVRPHCNVYHSRCFCTSWCIKACDFAVWENYFKKWSAVASGRLCCTRKLVTIISAFVTCSLVSSVVVKNCEILLFLLAAVTFFLWLSQLQCTFMFLKPWWHRRYFLTTWYAKTVMTIVWYCFNWINLTPTRILYFVLYFAAPEFLRGSIDLFLFSSDDSSVSLSYQNLNPENRTFLWFAFPLTSLETVLDAIRCL